MDDLAKLAALAADYASREHLTIIPAVPESGYGPEVILGPADMELPGFLALARQLGGGVLYLRAVPFDPDSGEDPPADAPAHLVRHKGQTGQVTAAFAANGIVHFWEQLAAWYAEWQELTSTPLSGRDHDEDQDQGNELSPEERERLASELADTILADPRFRAARRLTDQRRFADLAIPPGTDRRVGWDATDLACTRAQAMTQDQYDQIMPRLDDLTAELLGSDAYQQANSPAGRRHAIEQFLISRADGFWPPTLVRDELYARAQRRAKARKDSASELF
jgi:hypothetical protein